MENVKIRVQRGIEINVNDNGDTIVADVNDNIFTEKFYKLVETVERLSKEINGVDFDEDDMESAKNYVDLVKDKTVQVMNEIDNLFGENACNKIFGYGTSPSGYAIADFFDQLLPIFEAHANERQQKIANRYTRRRKGKK